MIPYIGALVGTTVLAGDSWTLRADVADTVALRRRKGTMGAIELLASTSLSGALMPLSCGRTWRGTST